MTGWVEFDLENILAGFSLENARGLDHVRVQNQGFYTSDDGPVLYTLLDEIYEALLRHVTDLPTEMIRTVLVNLKRRRGAVLINPPVELAVLTKRNVVQGEAVYRDDPADVVAARFPGYELPCEGSLIFIFQHQWRRGLYFDLRDASDSTDAPLHPLGDVGALLGSLYGALWHRDRIRMEQSVLEKMATDGWFPFTRLSIKLATELYRHYELDWDTTEVKGAILREISPQIRTIVESWSAKPAFDPHMSVLRDAARFFSQGEYRAAATMLLPKVEGVLRHIYSGTKERPGTSDLRTEFIGRVRAAIDGYTALLPESFVSYLKTYYFAGFNLATGNTPPSRHAFAHGVGPDALTLDPGYSLRLFLMLDQVFFCLSRMRDPARTV